MRQNAEKRASFCVFFSAAVNVASKPLVFRFFAAELLQDAGRDALVEKRYAQQSHAQDKCGKNPGQLIKLT